MSSKRDFYDVLGVSREANADELRKAYRREALKHHPDRNPGSAASEARFKEVNEAYQVLSDDQKREVYDRFGYEGLQGRSGPGMQGVGDVFAHMQDLFAEMFSSRGEQSRGAADVRAQVRLTLREAAFGCKREVTIRAPSPCTDCGGTGAKAGTKLEGCPQCRGTGQISNARGFVMFTSTCPRCRGAGRIIKHPCPTCAGHGAVERTRAVAVSFPPGIDAGQRLRVPGQGVRGFGGPAGDLYVEVDVEDDPRFERDGSDLVTHARISFADAALGGQIRVSAIEPEGDVTLPLTIPAGTQSAAVFTLKDNGIPRLDGRGRGSLVVVVQVDVPTTLTPRARELLAELGAELSSPAEGRQGKRAAG